VIDLGPEVRGVETAGRCRPPSWAGERLYRAGRESHGRGASAGTRARAVPQGHCRCLTTGTTGCFPGDCVLSGPRDPPDRRGTSNMPGRRRRSIRREQDERQPYSRIWGRLPSCAAFVARPWCLIALWPATRHRRQNIAARPFPGVRRSGPNKTRCGPTNRYLLTWKGRSVRPSRPVRHAAPCAWERPPGRIPILGGGVVQERLSSSGNAFVQSGRPCYGPGGPNNRYDEGETKSATKLGQTAVGSEELPTNTSTSWASRRAGETAGPLPVIVLGARPGSQQSPLQTKKKKPLIL